MAAVLSLATLSGLLATLPEPAMAQSLDGFWQSDAYGLVVQIDGGKMSTFQITAISCMPWWTAKRSDSGGSNNEAAFNRGDATVRLTGDPSAGALLMHEATSISSMSLRRIRSRPDKCGETLPDSPPDNYAVFWQTFAEHFALFPQYRTDWSAVDRKYRPRVTQATTPDELFEILREMILPFHNAHTNINAGSMHRLYIGYRPVSEIGRRLQSTSALSADEILGLFAQQARRSQQIVETAYSDGRLRSFVNEKIYFGMLRNSVGYLRILDFEEYAKNARIEEGAIALEAALDEIFKNAARMKGLIIDVRVNTGGADPLCLAIASRLSGAKYLAYSKVTRNSGPVEPLRFTAPQPAWVEASTRPGYRGNVVLLIGPDTLSGGETFAMALMGRTPRIKFVGENTQGVFSDVWGQKLPNGWTFGVPSEQYLTKAGKAFDGEGVPPDVRVPVYPKEDLESGRDGALERAIKVLAVR